MVEEPTRAVDSEVTDEELIHRLQRHLQSMTVAEHITRMMVSLSALAFERMGLVEEEKAGSKDLAQSKLAIEAFKALVEVVKETEPAETVNVLRSTLAQMQMAYVSQVSSRSEDQEQADGPPEAGPSATETSVDDGPGVREQGEKWE